MTDDAMKELVTKHDSTIALLASSIEHLIATQKETNNRLESLSKFSSKQVEFIAKVDNIDKSLAHSLTRVHRRINEIEETQKSSDGCNSVKLLNKDIESVSHEILKQAQDISDNRLAISALNDYKNMYPSLGAIKWLSGLLIIYSISFGTYVVQHFESMDSTDARVQILLERNIRDTERLIGTHNERATGTL